jgi:hypothetical protein
MASRQYGQQVSKIIKACNTDSIQLAQTGIASLGLTYSAVPGPEDVYLGSAISKISVPNLGRFTPENDRIANDFYGEAFAAHVLGDIGSSYNYSVLPEQKLDGSPWASNPAVFWNATDHWEYVSLNSTPSNYSSGPGILSVYTDRIIRSSGVCTTPAYQLKSTTVPATGPPALNLPDYTIIAAEFTLLESGEKVLFPLDALNGEGTYYLSSPYNESVCGPGCGSIKVVETTSGPPELGSFVGNHTGVFFYECNITVTPSSDSLPGSLTPYQASLAARAIALSGAIPQLGGDWESHLAKHKTTALQEWRANSHASQSGSSRQQLKRISRRLFWDTSRLRGCD